MLKWIRLKGEYGLGIKTGLVLVLCLYMLYQQHKHTVCDNKETEIKHQKHLSVKNFTEAAKPLRIRVRQLQFRQKRSIGVNLKHGKTMDRRNDLTLGKIMPVVHVKRKTQIKPRVIIKKHAVFRQKRFVLIRKKEQMGKTQSSLIDHKKTEH